jgi:hypothetical protein
MKTPEPNMMTRRRRKRLARWTGSRSLSSDCWEPEEEKAVVLPPRKRGRKKERMMVIAWSVVVIVSGAG